MFPPTLLSMGNLADTYAKQGKYAQAEAIFSQTTEISRRVLGPERTIPGLGSQWGYRRLHESREAETK